MDSDSDLEVGRESEEEEKGQDAGEVDTSELDAQIAALVEARRRQVEKAKRDKERRARENAHILVAVTPTKKEKVRTDVPLPSAPKSALANHVHKAKPARPGQPTQSLASVPVLPASATAGPSNFASKLAAVRNPSPALARTAPKPKPVPAPSQWAGRSRSIPKPIVSASASAGGSVKGKGRASDEEEVKEDVKEKKYTRDEHTLQIIEKLEMGPKEFGFDPEGEQVWEYVEPNSKIRLNERKLPHDTVQAHMYGRYYLPPSLLYSVIRLSRDGATYDVPVEGDWVTIAVVAEKSDIRVSGGGGGGGGGSRAEDNDTSEDEAAVKRAPERGDFSLASPSKKTYQKPKGKDAKSDYKRRKPKKYVNLKLAALPSRTKMASVPGAGGDAILQLLLFQAESVVKSEEVDEDGKAKVTYAGGSGGAFERWANLGVGDVVGIISPRILRPLKAGGSAPHPLTLPLALNPNSGDSVFYIGKSKDLGRCSAVQKDGNRCRSWVDMRQSPVCEYHVHLSMQRARAGRAEFTASTSSFALTNSRPSQPSRPGFGKPPIPGKGSGINHQTKTGLLPAGGPQAAPRGAENGGGGATYMVGGKTIRTDRSEGGLKGFGDEHLNERLGRNRTARDVRKKLEVKEDEEVLKRLMVGGQGSSGQRNLEAIRMKRKEREREEAGQKDKRKKRRVEVEEEKSSDADEEEEKKRPFNAESVKRIGFDPTAAARAATLGKDEKRRKDETIALLKNPDSGNRFNAKKKIRTENVKKPERYEYEAPSGGRKDSWAIRGNRDAGDESDGEEEEGMIDLD